MKWILILMLLVGAAVVGTLQAHKALRGAQERRAAASAPEHGVQTADAGTATADAPAADRDRAPDADAEPERAPAVRAEDDREGDHVYYQWVDESGVHFVDRLSDVPPEWRERAGRVEMATAPPINRTQAQAQRQAIERSTRAYRPQAPASPAEPRVRDRRKQVTLYTTSWCGYCKRARRYLDSIGVAYTEYDVERDSTARAEYLEKTGGRTGVPVIDVDGEILQGWSQARLDQMLGR